MMSRLPEKKSRDLSIIIVNWNTCELLRQCLTSLGPVNHWNWEVWVVDNASTDGSGVMVTQDFPEVKLLLNKTNVGFARANNQGIQASESRYVLLLNSDTIALPETLNQMIQFMDSQPRAGAFSPQLLRLDGSPQSYAFGGDPKLIYLLARGLNRLLFHRYLHDWSITAIQEVDWVSGACLMVRRHAIDQVGGLDENIFMYFEDNDWCLRMRQAGWKICYNPQMSIRHVGGQSLAQNPEARRAYYRSLNYFYAKHYGLLTQFLLRAGLMAYRLLARY